MESPNLIYYRYEGLTAVTEIKDTLDRCIRFLQSPSCIDNSETKARGGFFGFQNTAKPLRKTDEPFIFYEITGYGVNLLLKLSRWYGEPRFLSLAKDAADCIIKAQVNSDDPHTRGAVYDRYYPARDEHFPTFHAYPNAVCAGALCELYQLTKEPHLKESAMRIRDWLFQNLVRKEDACIGFSEFYSADQPSQKVFPYESTCIPFILLKFQDELELTPAQKDDLYQSVRWAIDSQTGEGFFPFFYHLQKQKYNTTAYSHFTIYPLYNLMGYPLAELEDIGANNSFEAYKKCAQWMLKVQGVDGGFYTYYHGDDHVWHQQSPAVGQALCTFTLMYEKTDERRYLEAARKAAHWLTKNQIDGGSLSGGFYWIYPNKGFSNMQKKIMYARERIRGKVTEANQVDDVTVLLDKVPIWPVQFAIEGLHRLDRIDS